MQRVTITFLGQCLVHGYEGVDAGDTFPEIVRRRLHAERADCTLVARAESFYHPAELPRKVRRLAARGDSDVVVIDVAGYFAARDIGAVDLSQLPSGVDTAYERVRHLRAVAKGFLRIYPKTAGLLRNIETTGVALATGVLRPLLRRYPAPTMAEYEQLLTAAIAAAQSAERMTVVLQGPGMFNDGETDKRYAPHTQAIYREVNAMARRVAEAHGLLFVDRMAVTDDLSVCLPGSIRLSARGHRVMGDVLFEELLRSRLV